MLFTALFVLLPAVLFAQTAAPLDVVLENLLDLNKDGKITITEAETYFLTYDTNKDGHITLAEFTTAVDLVDPAIVGNEQTLFFLFDRNADKVVDKSDIDAVFHLADLNKDNFIEKSELHLIIALAGSHVG